MRESHCPGPWRSSRLGKTKRLLREKVWFPRIDQCVKRRIKTCLACQANGPDNRSRILLHMVSQLSYATTMVLSSPVTKSKSTWRKLKSIIRESPPLASGQFKSREFNEAIDESYSFCACWREAVDQTSLQVPTQLQNNTSHNHHICPSYTFVG